MNSYDKKLLKERMYREMKRSVYLDIISKAFEEGDYEKLSPIAKINIMAVVSSHSKLSNRIES
jgi:hypothetical protein